jgi:rsbT co-antagonist protein RsbR
VGTIDAKRAQEIMDIALPTIRDTKARALIIDISGVPVVDASVADYLVKVTRATALMGCECTISGLSPAIAHTIVELGIDVGQMKTTANLRGAIADAYSQRGLRVTAKG